MNYLKVIKLKRLKIEKKKIPINTFNSIICIMSILYGVSFGILIAIHLFTPFLNVIITVIIAILILFILSISLHILNTFYEKDSYIIETTKELMNIVGIAEKSTDIENKKLIIPAIGKLISKINGDYDNVES